MKLPYVPDLGFYAYLWCASSNNALIIAPKMVCQCSLVSSLFTTEKGVVLIFSNARLQITFHAFFVGKKQEL